MSLSVHKEFPFCKECDTKVLFFFDFPSRTAEKGAQGE